MDYKLFTQFKRLPRRMEEAFIADKLIEALDAWRDGAALNANDAIYALRQLASRQEEHYRPFVPHAARYLDDGLVDLWESDQNLDLETWATLIIPGDGTPADPGTPRAMALLRMIALNDARAEARQLATVAIEETRSAAQAWPKYFGRDSLPIFLAPASETVSGIAYQARHVGSESSSSVEVETHEASFLTLGAWEYGPVRTSAQLVDALAKLGQPGREFAILQSKPKHFVQSRRLSDNTYQLEWRDGAVNRYFEVPGGVTQSDMIRAFTVFLERRDLSIEFAWLKLQDLPE
jgi:hypothetical protein